MDWHGSVLRAALSLALAACSSDDDGDIGAQDLRARLGNALSFEGGQREDGPAPPPSSEDEEAERIAGIVPPAAVQGGAGFSVRLAVVDLDEGATPDLLLAIDGWDAAHFRVAGEVRAAEGQPTVTLAGSLAPDESLFGQTFGLSVAVEDAPGKVSTYVPFQLGVAEQACEPAEEQCNGLDDDCDGAVDVDTDGAGEVCEAAEGEGEGEGEGEPREAPPPFVSVSPGLTGGPVSSGRYRGVLSGGWLDAPVVSKSSRYRLTWGSRPRPEERP